MKLGIDCRDLRAGSLTGIGRFVTNLLRALSLQPHPPDIFLYGNQHTAFTLHAHLEKPHRARTRRAREAATWWWDRVTLPKIARRDKLDVFLSPYFKAPGIRSCPVLTTIHDLLFLRMPPEISGRSSVYCRAFRSFAASFARRAAAILTVSQYSQRDIIELLEVPPRKIHVVGNCVNPEYRPIDDPARLLQARQSCHIDGDYLLYVGNFGPHKNVDGLLRTYAALPQDLRARYRLVLAGAHDKGTSKADRLIRELNLSDRVILPGYVQEEHLPALYAGASAFITLSRWEGFGLPVLEAMACATPVVCSNRTSLPEVTDGAALLADPDDLKSCVDALTRTLTDEPLRHELRTKGLERAMHFSPARFATLVLDALNAATESP